MYFNKKEIHTVQYLKQINMFIEMVICVAVDCKSDSRFTKGRESETPMVHENKT